MTDTPSSGPNPTRQVKQYLAALRAAGVEYVPIAPPLVIEQAAPEELTGPTLATPAALFDAAEGLPTTLEGRRKALELLAAEVEQCEKCPEMFSTRTQTVFGVGNIVPELCFVGEAPGADEDRQGEPFVGAAGQLLNKIIAAMGMSREEVFICNTVKCRPPCRTGNVPPTPKQRENCRPFFERQIELLQPKFICCLGATAAQNVLNTTMGIFKLRGRFHEYKGIPVLCTLHPSFLLREPGAKKDCWDDMKMLLRRMGRPIPGPGGK
ncbi:uracil-DNA glycosylase [Fimbriiglobus ruber]|uniref:Type-4 uracil-DNA glycosylase n=1 Tax=Fimbriiglobus ruber TaxID=1908690 RepID=A0A225DZY3_9BACT|nr:uracil-DNA glycosylase [Fimbriiglobus ruber]OWK46852.1 Uracil-DNA glycosylase, family 4 [Fimbriiglobus ruber]